MENHATKMRRLGAEAQEVVKNAGLTNVQKSERLNQIEREIVECKSKLNFERGINMLMAGADVVDPDALQRSMGLTVGLGRGTPARVKGISELAPLEFDEGAVRALHDAITHRARYRISARNVAGDGSIMTKAPTPSSPGVGGLLPPQFVGLVPFQHEPRRVLDLLPTSATESANVEYLRHDTTTGAAAVTAAGTQKPAVEFAISRNLAAMEKIAAVTTVQDEDLVDFPEFSSYVTTELMRVVIDAENAQVLNAADTGLFAQAGLTRAVATSESNIDTFEQAIADLRSGAAYCTPTAIVMHPATWSSTRREKDSYGRYLLNANPGTDTVNTLWGIQVLTTTTCPAGSALMFDGGLAANAYLRQGLSVEVDFGQFGFEYNTHSFRCEERLAVAVERPAAMINISGLT